MSVLLEPIRVGALDLANRVIMAPLTRCRAGEQRVPNELMVEYYRQRASAGMILTEATSVTPQGVGYPQTPGLWNDEQVAGWQKVTEAVHQHGGKIVVQLWHVGRISDPIYLHGDLPVAPSAIKPAGHVSLVRPMKEYVTPRALTTEEVAEVIAAYRLGAENALKAGFDGVELHAANGYLIDQFLQDSTNQRDDQYGGAIENRARLLLAVTDQLIDVWGADRVGVHLAPRCDAHDMGDSNPAATFGYVVDQLSARNIAFIFTREHVAEDSLNPLLKARFTGTYIANEGFTKTSAEQWIAAGHADAVAFGKDFIATPDLPRRFAENQPLNTLDKNTLYAHDAVGYTDYPALG